MGPEPAPSLRSADEPLEDEVTIEPARKRKRGSARHKNNFMKGFKDNPYTGDSATQD